MTFAHGRRGGVLLPVPQVLTGSGRLSLESRIRIELRLKDGFSLRAVAAELGVAPSTVSREVAAHRVDGVYSARVAQFRAGQAARRPRAGKLDQDPALRAQVVELLNDRLSPQQVAGRLRRLFPDDQDMHVSHESIYQALYVQGKGGLRHELAVEKALRSGRTTRKPQSRLPARSKRPWVHGANISTRPAEAADRAVPGHWEGDLVIGTDGRSGLVTLVERSSRFLLAARLPSQHDSTTVIDTLVGLVHTLPEQLKRSLAWDQGVEMAQVARFTLATDVNVYFCDPHSPWQRGTNENTNGLIRDYYPKNTHFGHVTDADINAMVAQLNRRPRETLNFATPGETLNELLNDAMTA